MQVNNTTQAPSLKHIVIVAGEESGDRHAADIVRELQSQHANAHFSGIGGHHMQEAGVSLISDLARFGVTGVTAVLQHFLVIRRAFKAIQTHLLQQKADLLILVDYPGFNLRLAKFAKRQGIRVLYYISPQIWAWKAGRIHTIRECVDHMAVILPFEKKIYEDAGVPVSFVGHPLAQCVRPPGDYKAARQALGLPVDTSLLALLPGSRRAEIEHHMPVLVETAKRLLMQHPQLQFVIPVAKTIEPSFIANYFKNTTLPITLIQGQSVEVAGCSDCIIVASGTASLECALLERPMCIIYKGSYLSYVITSLVIKVQYFGLANLLSGRMIVPELLQYDCNAYELTKVVNTMLFDNGFKRTITQQLSQLKDTLVSESTDISMHELIKRLAECS